jgi:FkbM family methyltransferase
MPGEAGLTGNIYCGLHEFADMAFTLHIVREDDLFVDVGANAGSYTILACAVKGARGYCMEPVPSTFLRLMSNIHLNKLSDRVKCLNVGISDHEGELMFTSDQNTGNHVVSQGENDTNVVKVKVCALDMILKGEAPTLIKIDVEGFETAVINGARRILTTESLCSVIMEMGGGNRYGYDETCLVRTMREFGFTPYKYDPFKRDLLRMEGRNPRGNTLFVRNEDTVVERLRLAPKFNIKGQEI